MQIHRFLQRPVNFLLSHKYQILTILFVIAVVSSFVIWYVSQEQKVFFWDSSGYWIKTIGFSEWIGQSLRGAVSGLIHSIRYDEYNLLFTLPLTLVDMLFGQGRLTYILGIFTLYFLPVTFLLALICYRLTADLWPTKRVTPSWKYTIIWVSVILNPFMILPILGGYPDVVGLIPLCVSFLIYIKNRKSLKTRHLVYIAILLLLATLLRRWYIFGAAGLMLTICFDQVISLKVWEITKKKFLALLKLAVLPVLFTGLFTFIAFDYVKTLLTTDYSVKYAAYKFHDNYFELGLSVIEHYGILLSLFVVLGLVALLTNKKVDRRLIVAVLLSQAFAFFAVGRVQTFDVHQYYLLTVGLLVCLSAAPFVLVRYRQEAVSVVIFVVFALIIASSWLVMYRGAGLQIGFSDAKSIPESRNDLRTLERIYQDVHALDTSDRVTDTIYVLACSFEFNVDIFRNIPLSLDNGMDRIDTSRFTPSAIFDVAQGFDKKFFDSNLVLDSTPVGYITANEEEQQIITLLHQELQQGGRLQEYYRIVNRYSIEGNYTVDLLERVKEIPRDVQDAIVVDIQNTHTTTVPIFN